MGASRDQSHSCGRATLLCLAFDATLSALLLFACLQPSLLKNCCLQQVQLRSLSGSPPGQSPGDLSLTVPRPRLPSLSTHLRVSGCCWCRPHMSLTSSQRSLNVVMASTLVIRMSLGQKRQGYLSLRSHPNLTKHCSVSQVTD